MDSRASKKPPVKLTGHFKTEMGVVVDRWNKDLDRARDYVPISKSEKPITDEQLEQKRLAATIEVMLG